MRRLILGVAILAVGCEKAGPAVPVLRGVDQSPHTGEGKKRDGRYVEFICSSCGQKIEDGAATCTNSVGKGTCKAKVTWPDTYPCPNCRGTGQCQGCLVYGTLAGPQKGSCWKCSDGWTADNVLCANCRVDDSTSDGKCPICKGTAACDWCKGENEAKMTSDQLKAFAQKEKPATPTETPAPETPPTQ